MVARKSYDGVRFGNLVVLCDVESNSRHRKVKCVCDCGNEKDFFISNIKRGYTSSCGCLHKEVISESSSTHKMSKSKTYSTWLNMKARCSNENNPNFSNYGGRGIKVCDRWINSFENFISDMGERPRGLTIDRIDVNGNYEPSNCRWASDKQQARNKRNTYIVEFNGVIKPLIEHCNDVGIEYKTVFKRISQSGYSIDKALTKKVQKRKSQ